MMVSHIKYHVISTITISPSFSSLAGSLISQCSHNVDSVYELRATSNQRQMSNEVTVFANMLRESSLDWNAS